MSEVFANEPLLELRRAEIRAEALQALARLDATLPLEVPICIGDERIHGEVVDSLDPSCPERVVARAHSATIEHVEQALATAAGALHEWAARAARERAEILQRAADLLAQRRLELAALAVRECGKPWIDADADVCEAIDFLRYYAIAATALDRRSGELLQLPGERNTLRYVPRGVAAVIAPWNFPLAIAAGMTSAALAAGNAVVLKPAEQAPACAAAIVDALHAAGVPRGALSLLPGGDEVGAALVGHPRVHMIVFTGSRAVGLEIVQRAATMVPGQRHIKHVVAEMGGKNCVIVDADADLDDVVPAVLSSAFGFAGQKCSAASLVLVHADVAEALTERLAGAIQSLRVGPAEQFASDVPAVIDAPALRRVNDYVSRGAADATLTFTAPQTSSSSGGYYVSPALLCGLGDDHPVVAEEIFGPVLALQSVPDIATACAKIEASDFALTGGLFSRSPRTIERVAQLTPVGNLYVNREITGAMVGRQPFGGGRLSGTGPQAGGPDYVLHFVQARVTCENTMRHGLVV